MSEHAKGPLRAIATDRGNIFILTDKGNPICEFVDHGVALDSSQRANAVLMAAAPELLEAVQSLVDCWPYPDFEKVSKALDLGKAAVQKAQWSPEL